MALNRLSPGTGGTRPKRRVGRGIGSGMGKTATRGTKGQSARRQINPNFEGGQSPLQRRLPVKKGFRNVNHKVFSIINLDDLQNLFEAGAHVTEETLIASGIISKAKDGVKVLAFGTLDKALTVTANKFSEAAKAAIEKAGGTAIAIVEPEFEQPKKPVEQTRGGRKSAAKGDTTEAA